MDRETLTSILARGPARIRMNDGKEVDVPSADYALVSDISATVLYRSESDGKWRTVHLPLVTMAAVEELSPGASGSE